MNLFPAVVLVLLAFAAFFMTVAVAPLVVLTIFYLVYALWTSRSKAPPPPKAEPQPRWESQPEARSDAPPARRARITAVSHSAAAAAQGAGAQDARKPADPGAGAQDAPELAGSGAGTTTLTQRTS